GLLLPAVQKVRQAAARAQSSNNLKQMGLATHNMNDTYSSLPPAVGHYPANSPVNGTVQYFMLPFIEQDNVYKAMAALHPDSWWCGYGIKTYISPSDPSNTPSGLIDAGSPRYGTSYAPNEWVFNPQAGYGFNTHNQISGAAPAARIPATFVDGTSN